MRDRLFELLWSGDRRIQGLVDRVGETVKSVAETVFDQFGLLVGSVVDTTVTIIGVFVGAAVDLLGAGLVFLFGGEAWYLREDK